MSPPSTMPQQRARVSHAQKERGTPKNQAGLIGKSQIVAAHQHQPHAQRQAQSTVGVLAGENGQTAPRAPTRVCRVAVGPQRNTEIKTDQNMAVPSPNDRKAVVPLPVTLQ